MRQQRTKKQHYVPRFYLKNFSNNGKVIVYDKMSKRIFGSNIRDICCQNHMYETLWAEPNDKIGNYISYNEMERALSEREGDYAPILDKIIEICCNKDNSNVLICHKNEKEGLRSFIANLLCRSRVYIQFIEDETKNNNVKDYKELQMYRDVVDSVGVGDWNAYVGAAVKRMAVDDKMENSPAYMIKKQLESMEFCFCVTQKDEFITADFPFVCTFFESEETKLRTLFCPLHPKVGVLFFCSDILKENYKYRNRICRMGEKEAIKLNNFVMNDGKPKYLISNQSALLERVVESKGV